MQQEQQEALIEAAPLTEEQQHQVWDRIRATRVATAVALLGAGFGVALSFGIVRIVSYYTSNSDAGSSQSSDSSVADEQSDSISLQTRLMIHIGTPILMGIISGLGALTQWSRGGNAIVHTVVAVGVPIPLRRSAPPPPPAAPSSLSSAVRSLAGLIPYFGSASSAAPATAPAASSANEATPLLPPSGGSINQAPNPSGR